VRDLADELAHHRQRGRSAPTRPRPLEPARKARDMLSHYEQRILDDIGQHLDDDPIFAERLRRCTHPLRTPPTKPAPSNTLLAMIAIISVAAWVEVGLGWLAALICATIPATVFGHRAMQHRRP
jgi:Protein of unknown function (DUF3040)